jgi:polyisoprenoid-binding protein YceI
VTTSETATNPAVRQIDGRPAPAPGTYAIDPSHSSVEFVVRHLMISKVRGRFGAFSGQFVVADQPEQSSASVEIQAASVDTGDAQRDGHLRSADFFDAETYPLITFNTTGVAADGDGWKLQGDLTVRGVTVPVVLDLEFEGGGPSPFGDVRVGFTASGELDREQFGLTWNQALETGGVLVGKKARIELAVEAIKQD